MTAAAPLPTLGVAKVKPLVYASAAVAAIGGLIFGYDIGGSGGTFTMDGFRDQMDWGPLPASGQSEKKSVSDAQGWITSVFALGAVAGSIPSGYFTDKFGRRPTLMLYAMIFIVSAVIMGVSPNVACLDVGRFIGGIGVGGLSMATTMYQSEIAPERIRGMLVALQQLSITFGIFLAALFNVGLQHWSQGWRFSYMGNGFFAVALLVLIFFCPESPRWLHKVGRVDEAKATLHKVLNDDEVEHEYDMICQDERVALAAAKSKWSDLFRAHHHMSYRTFVGTMVLFLQQFTGINAIMYFAPVIFADFLSSNLALLANLLLQFLNFVSTFITIACVDKFGRRTLLIYGSFMMAVFSYVVAILSSHSFNYNESNVLAALIVVFCALYVISFAYSWGPVGWIVPAEIFPMHLRGKGMSITTTGNWLANFAIGRLTPELLRKEVFDLYGTFVFFGSCCVGMGFFTLLFVPETRSVALEQMTEVVGKFRKMSYVKRLTHWRLQPEAAVAHKEVEMAGSGKHAPALVA